MLEKTINIQEVYAIEVLTGSERDLQRKVLGVCEYKYLTAWSVDDAWPLHRVTTFPSKEKAEDFLKILGDEPKRVHGLVKGSAKIVKLYTNYAPNGWRYDKQETNQ